MEWENTRQEKMENKDDEESIRSSPLGADLKMLVNNEKFSDVSFVVGEEKVKMYALKGILSARSKVFCRMFEGGFSEGSQRCIPLPDVDPGLFFKALDYIYTGTLAFDVEDIVDLYAVADRYFIPALMDECLQQIEEHLTPENVTILYEKAGDGNQEVLREKCFRFIMERAEEVFNTEQWKHTNYEDVIAIVKSESLAVPEIFLLKAVLRWGDVTILRNEELSEAARMVGPSPIGDGSPMSLSAADSTSSSSSSSSSASSSSSSVASESSPLSCSQVAPSSSSSLSPSSSSSASQSFVVLTPSTPEAELKKVLEEIRLPLIPPLFLRELVEPLTKAGLVTFDKLLEAYRFHADASLVGPLESARLRNVMSPVLAADGSVNVVRVPFQDFNVTPGKYFKRISPAIDCLVGCHWQLILKNKLNSQNLSLYVKCNVSKLVAFELGHTWRVRDQGMKFGLINQLNRSKSIWKSWHKYGEVDNKPWRSTKTRYGFGYVVKLSALMDPQAGFVVNNCLVMEVRIPTIVSVETIPVSAFDSSSYSL